MKSYEKQFVGCSHRFLKCLLHEGSRKRERKPTSLRFSFAKKQKLDTVAVSDPYEWIGSRSCGPGWTLFAACLLRVFCVLVSPCLLLTSSEAIQA